MADTKTSDEAAAGALDGTELVRIVKGGANKVTTTADIAGEYTQAALLALLAALDEPAVIPIVQLEDVGDFAAIHQLRSVRTSDDYSVLWIKGDGQFGYGLLLSAAINGWDPEVAADLIVEAYNAGQNDAGIAFHIGFIIRALETSCAGWPFAQFICRETAVELEVFGAHPLKLSANGNDNQLNLNANGSVAVGGGGLVLPTADPLIAGAWWDNAGVLTKSAG